MITPLAWQQRLLATPEDWNLFLGGGRGGGKTTAAGLLALRYHVMYRDRAKTLIVRPDTYKGVSDTAENLQHLFGYAFGRSAVSYNQSDHVIKLAEHGTVEFSALDKDAYDKFQGREFGIIIADEAGNFSTLKQLDRLRSNLRRPGMPTRLIIMANPGGIGHGELLRRYVSGRKSWRPFVAKDGETWVTVPTTLTDNAHLDHERYRAKLRAAANDDEALVDAWISGDWSSVSGAFFAKVLGDALWLDDTDRDGWREVLRARPRKWQPSLSIDWGLTAPAVVLFGVRALVNGAEGGDGRVYRAGARVIIDELHTALGDDPNQGAGWSPGMLGAETADRCASWGGFDHVGVVDDARNLDGTTLIKDLAKCGLSLRRPIKSRVDGWTKLKAGMAAAHKNDPDLIPLYFSERCRYLAETLPTLKRNPLKPEDIMQYPKQPDHGADAARYYVCDEPQVQGVGQAQIVRAR